MFSNTFPFAIKTHKTRGVHWVENVLTGDTVSLKNLSKKEAEEIAQAKYLELIEATGTD